ncbi:chemokine (C-X-C motif) ligand 18a, duplicate 1 [Trichomycterus rosablanca]|uniref:chemokine (C-X-C motif) ligand 18a, duplicate 1 n=1 Tax=Trichomycterus rosablanca TaxID=2290929 RepID=UPI002F35124A
MAFIPVQVTAMLLILLFSNFLKDNLTGAVHIPHKCRCPEMNDTVRGRVTDFEVIKPGSSCNKVEIILQTEKQFVCLDPQSKQGKKLLKCWKRKEKKSCLPRKTKKRQKRKRQKLPK